MLLRLPCRQAPPALHHRHRKIAVVRLGDRQGWRSSRSFLVGFLRRLRLRWLVVQFRKALKQARGSYVTLLRDLIDSAATIEAVHAGMLMRSSALEDLHLLPLLRGKGGEPSSPLPYLATLLNCMLWVFYGLPIVHPNSIPVVPINGIDVMMETAYIIIFFVYSTEQLRLNVAKILLAELVFMAAVVTVVLTTVHTHERRSLIVGVVCVIFGTFMYASPLANMRGPKYANTREKSQL